MQEFELIKKIFLPLTKSKSPNSKKTANKNLVNKFSALELQDDIAIIDLDSKHDLIISKDIFIEDVHFLKSDGASKIASKLLLTNLSDIASSGAKPLCYALGFTKNNLLEKKFYRQFGDALNKIQRKYHINLIGGDTSNSQKLFYSITIFGVARKNKILLRKNAQNGDLIFVSNTVGDAYLGLYIKQKNSKKISNYEKKLLQKHFYPEPRIELSQQLIAKNLSTCATDISDGLIADLANICKASKLNAKIFLPQIPISSEAKKFLQKNPQITTKDLITGGDDYELIFSVNPKNLTKVQKLATELKIDLTCIGEFCKESYPTKKTAKKFDVFLFGNQQNDAHQTIINLQKRGYEHQ